MKRESLQNIRFSETSLVLTWPQRHTLASLLDQCDQAICRHQQIWVSKDRWFSWVWGGRWRWTINHPHCVNPHQQHDQLTRTGSAGKRSGSRFRSTQKDTTQRQSGYTKVRTLQ